MNDIRFPSPLDFPDSPLSQVVRQPMITGLFLPVSSGGQSPSTLPRTTSWTFDYNAALTLRAEAMGLDIVFGVGEWLSKGGYGGETGFHAQSLDSFIAGSALTSITKRILIVSTVHVLYGLHPLHLAKFGATLDHISGGRWGPNVVTGHRLREHGRFGIETMEHDRRYEMADEFTRFVAALWGDDANLSVAGEYWKMEDAYCGLRPRFGRPIMVTATSSAAGIDYAVRHCDLVFISTPASQDADDAIAALPALVKRFADAAAEIGVRPPKLLINPMIVCRRTEVEALAYREAILAGLDEGVMSGIPKERSDAHAFRGHDPRLRALGGNIHIVGNPEQVVDTIGRLKKVGIDGIQMGFFDFAPDLEFFGEHVLPLMVQAGLRV